MSSTSPADNVSTPNFIVHTFLTFLDCCKGISRPTCKTYVLGTHGSLDAAKAFALQSIEELGYHSARLLKEVAIDSDELASSDNAADIVLSRSTTGQSLTLGIQSTPNPESLNATANGDLILPGNTQWMHYLMVTKIDASRHPATQTTRIQQAYVRRSDAWSAAHRCLDRRNYTVYKHRSDAEFWACWPYGKEVVVYAVSDVGETQYVSVGVPVWTNSAQEKALSEVIAKLHESKAK